MASKQQNFENRYFDQMDQNFKDVKGHIKELTDATNKGLEEVNKRLIKVEDKIFPAQQETVKQLPSVWRDPQVIKLLTFVAIFLIIVAIIVAAITGTVLPKGLFG